MLKKRILPWQSAWKHHNNPSLTWIQVHGVSSSEEIVSIGKHFKLHSLVLEDILHTNQRAKLDTYQEQVFIISRLLHYDEKKALLTDEQISLYLALTT